MSGTLFGFYGLGLRSLQAAQLGIQIAGNNIANVNTPGYARRRLELESGIAIRVQGGLLNMGVDVGAIRRQESRLLQFGLERELGGLSHSEERLRGLQDIEALFGTLDGNGVATAYADFADRFTDLAAQPESLTHRRAAVSAADSLARRLRELDGQLVSQREQENRAVQYSVTEINRLAEDLARLNDAIFQQEADGTTAAPLRDERAVVVEQLVAQTGGRAIEGEGGRLYFNLKAGYTLVTGSQDRPLSTSRGPDGTTRISISGVDITDRMRSGKIGAQLTLRDEDIPAKRAELDAVAADLITRANALVTLATDLQGNAGVPLFEPDPPPATGAATLIAVSSAVSDDPRLLGISSDGAPGNGSVALALGELRETSSAALGDRSPGQYIGDLIGNLGSRIAETEVATEVATALVDQFTQRRESVSGVSLDEEAVELLRFQRSYEAAVRFMNVLNDLTEIALQVGA